MDVTIFFWLFVLIAVLQPVVSRRLRESSRANIVRRIENRRKSRVVAVTALEESMRFLGFPLSRRYEVTEPEAVLRALELTSPELPIDLVLHVPEGVDVEAAQIARAVRRHEGRVTVLIPHFARSGSALIAFAADEIVLSPNAVLGSVSPWVDGRPAASILRVAREAKGASTEDARILADRAERAIARSKELLRELLGDKFPQGRAEELAASLAEGDWSDRELAYEDLAAAGFPVRKDLPCEVLQLIALYPQRARCERP